MCLHGYPQTVVLAAQFSPQVGPLASSTVDTSSCAAIPRRLLAAQSTRRQHETLTHVVDVTAMVVRPGPARSDAWTALSPPIVAKMRFREMRR